MCYDSAHRCDKKRTLITSRFQNTKGRQQKQQLNKVQARMMKSSRENAEVQTNTRGVDTKGLINREKRWEKECKNIKRNYKIKLKCKLVPLVQTISLHSFHKCKPDSSPFKDRWIRRCYLNLIPTIVIIHCSITSCYFVIMTCPIRVLLCYINWYIKKKNRHIFKDSLFKSSIQVSQCTRLLDVPDVIWYQGNIILSLRVSFTVNSCLSLLAGARQCLQHSGSHPQLRRYRIFSGRLGAPDRQEWHLQHFCPGERWEERKTIGIRWCITAYYFKLPRLHPPILSLLPRLL